MEFFTKAQYYNKAEGDDFVGKMVATNKYMLAGAIPAATMDVLMYSHPKGAIQTLARYARWIGPAMGMASMFTAGAYLACHLRGKDDKINYIIGSCGAAGVFGKAVRNPTLGFQMCVFFSIAACFKKISVEEGWTWFPSTEEVERKHVYGTLKTSKYDWTLIKDTPEKGWTTQRSS